VFAEAREHARRVMRPLVRWLAVLVLAFAAVGAGAGTAKSGKPCVVESYRCTTESTRDSTVRCASGNRVMTFGLDLHG